MKGWPSAGIWVALALVEFTLAGFSPQPEMAYRHFNDRQQQIDKGLVMKVAAVKKQHPKAEKQQRPPSAQSKLPIGLNQALFMIRSTLLTLNDANRTGNYTVIRDLAAPGVQAKYSPADLAQIFSSLRANHVDLSAVALVAPQLSTPPKLQNNTDLRLSGHFRTRPRQINFDLLFQNVAGEWKWFGISVTAPEAPLSQKQ